MRSFQRIFCCLLPLVSLAAAGCDGGTTDESVGTGTARIVLTSQGSAPATLHVTTTDDATGGVVLDRTVALTAGKSSVLDVALDAAAYTVHVDATRTGHSDEVIGSTAAHAELSADQTKEIRLTARDDGSAGGGSVSVSVTTAPMIHGIAVASATNCTAAGAGAEKDAQITVDASDPDGHNLRFFWSGLGIDGAMEGTSTLSISALAAATFTGAPIVHLVVQDSAGATTTADIAFRGTASCLPLCGTATTTVSTDSGIASTCLDARGQCNAACDNESDPVGNTACLTSCGIVLVSCLSN